MSRNERLTADLERAFTALEEGHLDDAETILERCKRIDRTHEGVIQLAAAIADARGDADEALAQYRKLVELVPDDAMPRLCVARIELHDLGDIDGALETLEEAFDFIDDEADLVDGIMLRTEALIARDDLEAARTSLAELSTSVIDDGEVALDLAELALGAEDIAAAERWIEIARKQPEHMADALHMLGRLHEAKEEHAKMVEAWLEVRRLDLLAPAPTVTISEDEVEKIATAAFTELPETIRKRLENVPIMIDDVPSEELVREGVDPRLLGLFQGAEMAAGDDVPTLTSILLFKRNLERAAQDREHLEQEIRITVLHETAHYFGLDDDDLEQLGLD